MQLLTTLRLPLVFDLDETLLVAKSQSQLSRELKALREVRCDCCGVPAALPGWSLPLLSGCTDCCSDVIITSVALCCHLQAGRVAHQARRRFSSVH